MKKGPNDETPFRQDRDGTFTPIVVGGRDAPGGTWPRDVGIQGPMFMNQAGDLTQAWGSHSR